MTFLDKFFYAADKLSVVPHTCDGLCVPAVRQRRVRLELAKITLAHILLFVFVLLVRLRVWVRFWVWGRGGQLGSPLTGVEINGPWASGAPLVYRPRLMDSRNNNLDG